MASANLRWNAQTKEAELQIAALKAIIDSVGGGSTGSSNRSKLASDLRRIGKDGQNAGNFIDRAFKDIPKSLDKMGGKLSGPFGILKPLGLLEQFAGKAGQGVQKLGGWLGDLAKPLEQVAGEGEQVASGFLGMAGTMGPLVTAAGPVVTIFLALGGALLVLPVLAAAVTAALVALLDIITTLTAVVAGFTGPLLTVGVLLGGLGAAFAYVAKQSLANKSSLQDQKDALLQLHVAQQTYNADLAKYGSNATQTEKALLALHVAQDKYSQAQLGVAIGTAHLDEKFHALVQTLSHDFQPYILKLVDSASQALTYLDKIAKLPLAEAFHSLATKGVRMLDQFVRGIGSAIADPIRLAIKVAFGKSSGLQGALQGWWDSARQFLFGYTKQKKFIIDGHTIGFSPQHMAGALQPLINWFGRQHFESTGLAWSHSIVNGITKKGGFWDSIKPFVKGIAKDAGDAAGRAFVAAFEAELSSLPGAIAHAINPFAGDPQANGGHRPAPYQHIPPASSGGGGGGGGTGVHGAHGSSPRMSNVLVGHVYVDGAQLQRHLAGRTARRGG